MEVFLMVNGYEIEASVESGGMDRKALTQWLRAHIVPLGGKEG